MDGGCQRAFSNERNVTKIIHGLQGNKDNGRWAVINAATFKQTDARLEPILSGVSIVPPMFMITFEIHCYSFTAVVKYYRI